MPDIVSIGECFLELMSHEPIETALHFDKGFTGDTLNVLTMASRLGSTCGYITRVSDDPVGDYLLDAWRNLNVDTSHVRQARGFNAFEFHSPTPEGVGRTVYYRKGSVASTMASEDLDAEYIIGAKVLHVSAITQGMSATCREMVLQAVLIAHGNGVIVSYDTNFRPVQWVAEEAREAMEEVLPYVDIILPSHPHEPRALIGLDSEKEVIDYFLSRGIGTVVLKCGKDGVWVGAGEDKRRIPAIAPRGVLDPMAAGDTFVGGFLHCFLVSMDAFEAARWGVASAGLKMADLSIVGQPSLKEVEECLGQVVLLPV